MGPNPATRNIVLMIVGVGAAAFLIGYGITALAYTRGASPSEVRLVPDVRDLTVPEARRLMDRAELTLAVGDSFPNAETPAGAILTQTPLPGQEVSPGVEVRVIVSTGQPRPRVPEVEAMPVALATRSLQAAGFDVLVEEAPGEGTPGRVVGVIPEPGTAVTLPATVRLRVGSGALEMPMPVLIGMDESTARQTVEAAGLTIGEIVYEGGGFGGPGEVVGQEPPPGESVSAGAEVRLRINAPFESTGPAGADGGVQEEAEGGSR